MFKNRYIIVYILLFLIGLNFKGNAVLLTYVLLLYTVLFIKRSRKLPLCFFSVGLFVIAILVSIIIVGTDNMLYQLLKNGTYLNVFMIFYLVSLDNYEYFRRQDALGKLFSDCLFYFSAGNMLHLVFNVSITNLSELNLGYRILNDYWSGGTAPSTIVLGWGCFLFPIFMYYFERIKKQKVKFAISAIMLGVYIVYSFQIATRMGIVNIALLLFLYWIIKVKQKEIQVSASSLVKRVAVVMVCVFVIIKMLPFVFNSNLYARMVGESLSLISDNGRLEATIYLLQHFSESLMGGGYFMKQYGLQQHNMLFQIYDLYGIISFIMLIVVFISLVKNTVRICGNSSFENSDKRYFLLVVVALFLYLFEEPAFSSNFIITAFIMGILGFSATMRRME